MLPPVTPIARSQPINHRDYIVELTSTGHSAAKASPDNQAGGNQPAQANHARPWLAVYWKCCRTYSRIYRNSAGDAYQGQCPRCGKKTRATVGPGGLNTRFFTAE